MRVHTSNSSGFTLMEVLVAIISSSFVIAGIYQVFYAHQNSYLHQDESLKMIQNLRASIYQMSKDIRSIGYNPTRGTYLNNNIPTNRIGFVRNFEYDVFNTASEGSQAGGPIGSIDYATETTRIAFTLDKDGDGKIEDDNLDIYTDNEDSDGEGESVDNEENDENLDADRDDGARGERVAYRLFGNKLQRFNSEQYALSQDLNKSWETLATDIEALNFVFVDADGDRFSGTDSELHDIKSVEVTLLVRSGSINHNKKGNYVYQNRRGDIICDYCSSSKYRYKMIQSRIKLRNDRGYKS